MKKQDEGFTLIELLIVIVILGILATVVVFSVRGITDESQQNSCDTDARTVAVAIEAYFAENGDQWVYGEDFLERVREAGLEVRTDTLFSDCDDEYRRRHGLKREHELLVAFKSEQGARRFPAPRA